METSSPAQKPSKRLGWPRLPSNLLSGSRTPTISASRPIIHLLTLKSFKKNQLYPPTSTGIAPNIGLRATGRRHCRIDRSLLNRASGVKRERITLSIYTNYHALLVGVGISKYLYFK